MTKQKCLDKIDRLMFGPKTFIFFIRAMKQET